MISFYPGPSRVHDKVPSYVKDAYKKGVLSINHRSEEFMNISERTITALKKKLKIPNDYTIFYTSSATECWEIIAQSLNTKKSFHIYNGSFGSKWYDYTKKLHGGVRSFSFGVEELINVNKLKFHNEEGIICITQNETSNGTQVSDSAIKQIKENNPSLLVAVDATSSMAGINLDFTSADIWLASVQKCFGLPAGLGLMACSPQALSVASQLNERDHYNSLIFMDEMMMKWQTPFTPNVLGIYLLMRVMEDAEQIETTHHKLVKRYKDWCEFLTERTSIHHLINNEDAHSYTVLPITGEEGLIKKIKTKAKKKGILLGEGYGEFKSSTFRIANFPAIRKKEINTLKDFLSDF
jgi:phosphoserine aminotransferase